MSSNFYIELPDEYLIEIGKISYLWSVLEGTLELCLVKLSGMNKHDPRSLIPYNHMTFPLKLDVLSTFMHCLVPGCPHLENYKEIIALLKQAQSGRNKIMHAKWSRDEKTNVITIDRVSARGKFEVKMEPCLLRDLIEIQETISNAEWKLWVLVFPQSAISVD